MKFPTHRLSFRHFTYSLIIVLSAFAPGFASLLQSYFSIKETSKNLNALDLQALLETAFGIQVLQYLIVMLLLTFLFTILCSYSSIKLSKLAEEKINPKIMLYAFPATAILGLLVIHSWVFPFSRHTYSTLNELHYTHPASIIGIASLVSIFYFVILKSIKLFSKFKTITAVAISSSLVITLLVNHTTINKPHTKQPNIFFIGVDSLRLDLMDSSMPFLQSKIRQSKSIKNAYTPFARTFPSWSTILSGQYPPTSGARYNLIDESLLNQNTSYLPSILKKHGYLTAYASDERRFSQIGKFHGFDHVLGPRTGLSDFVLGSYADHPLTNLFTMLPNSDIFLPEISVNRAASRTYNPNNFSDYLDEEVEQLAKSNKPIFMATHFCLAHWPFKHGSSEQDPSENGISQYYLGSLNDVDNQIKRLWQKLEQLNLIENSIFLFLSDHGESWTEDYSFLNQQGQAYQFKTHGHGINIISDNEHKVLMAFMGHKGFKNINTKKTSTLADITPTILSTLGIPLNEFSFDGFNLLKEDAPKTQIFPVESGFTVTATIGSNINTEKAAQQAMSRYKINPNGEMRIKVSEVPFLDNGKRIGVRNEEFLLTYQAPVLSTEKQLLLLNLSTLDAKQIKSKADLTTSLDKELVKNLCKWFPAVKDSIDICDR